jgi:hypothetical protein
MYSPLLIWGAALGVVCYKRFIALSDPCIFLAGKPLLFSQIRTFGCKPCFSVACCSTHSSTRVRGWIVYSHASGMELRRVSGFSKSFNRCIPSLFIPSSGAISWTSYRQSDEIMGFLEDIPGLQVYLSQEAARHVRPVRPDRSVDGFHRKTRLTFRWQVPMKSRSSTLLLFVKF